MKLRNVKTSTFSQNKTLPIFKNMSSRNINRASRSPTSTNNISEIDSKETFNIQNFQNSMMTLDISFNETSRIHEESENYALYKKYLISKTEYNKMISEISYIDNKITQNNNTIQNLEKYLSNLKEQKNEKNAILIDLLSNKESLEEIYNIKLSSLQNNSQLLDTKKNNGQIKTKNNKIINKNNNNSINNNEIENSPFATIKILEDNDDNLEIHINDIKNCDKKKYIEQIINLTEDILQKKEIETRNKLMQKINIGFQRFLSETKSSSVINPKIIISNFFSKISIFISNQSKGKFSEPLINSFLRELLKINSINDEISEILKFLNKIYKDKKKEIKEKISNLINKNESLKTKKKTYESKKNIFKQFIDDNKDRIKGGERNKISLENVDKQCMSFFLDNHFQEELGFLNDGKKDDNNEKTMINNDIKNNSNENNEIIVNENDKDKDDKVNQVKVLNVQNLQNKWNEKCNGINNINVNNLLINNNINIENNNNIINNNSDNNNNLKKIENKEENNINNIEKNNIDKDNNINSNINNGESNIDEYKNKKNIVMLKDMRCIPLKKIKLTPHKIKTKRLIQLNATYFYNKSKSPSRTKTLSYNDINNYSFNANSISNPKFKLLTQGITESFCYFKLSDNSNVKFNPLNNKDANPIKYNYFEGSILIDKFFNKLKIIQKSEEKYIGIDLKDIVDINLSEEMEKIIKIYKVYLKYGKNQENFDVNNFISTNKEIIGIRMHKNEKIKAVECKYFILTILMGKRFVPKAEFIFDNYDNFNMWYDCLKNIVKLNNNNKDKGKK